MIVVDYSITSFDDNECTLAYSSITFFFRYAFLLFVLCCALLSSLISRYVLIMRFAQRSLSFPFCQLDSHLYQLLDYSSLNVTVTNNLCFQYDGGMISMSLSSQWCMQPCFRNGCDRLLALCLERDYILILQLSV